MASRRFEEYLRTTESKGGEVVSARESPLQPGAVTQVKTDGGAVARTIGHEARQSADIAEQKQGESLLSAEKRTLEMIANGVSLTDVLEDLCGAIDAQDPDIISTVLLMDPDRKRLWPAALRMPFLYPIG